MKILGLALLTYNIVGTGFSIVGGINHAIKHFCKTTAEDLFKKSFDKVVKQYASDFADLADPKTVVVDPHTLENVIASLKDEDEVQFTQLNESEKIAKFTTLFCKCIIIPKGQHTDKDIERRVRPIIERVIIDFYGQLPFKQEAFNQIVFEFIQYNIKSQDDVHTLLTELPSNIEQVQKEITQRLTEDIQAVKDDTERIIDDTKEIKQTTGATYDAVREVKSQLNINTSELINTAVAKEHHAEIENAQIFLKNHKPKTSLELLETLKKRTWKDASEDLKFSILTNIAAAQFALNNEQDAAMLLLQAFQYNREDERALSNRALAHLLLKEVEKAEEYANQTLEKNCANSDAYVILIGTSTEGETLDEIIANVPEYLQDSPQIAYAISELAKHRENFEAAKRWGEIMVDKGNTPDFKAAFATILINEVLKDHLVVGTSQIPDSQKVQLQRAIEFLTEAWNCVYKTELMEYRADWIINRGIAYFHLGELTKAKEDLDTALKIENSNPILIKNCAFVAFECGDIEQAIELLDTIQSAPEVPEAPIMLANFLMANERFGESIKILKEFLQTDLSLELQEKARRLLINVYIADKRIDDALAISIAMRESTPKSIPNLVDAARIYSANEKRDEAISLLKEAYNYVQDGEEFLDILELADQLYIHEQFKEATTLYEKLADTNQNSQMTQWLIQSYYNSGEIAKALEICQELREKYGPLENISLMEIVIYEEIGDMNQAETVCREYLTKFPTDYDMQIRLGMVLFRANKETEIDDVLDCFPDSQNFSFLKNLSLEACVQFAYLHQLRSKPEKALQVMYETRRTRLDVDDPDTHLKYIRLFYHVEKQIPDLLNPTQVQLDTAVQIDISGQDHWYIIEDRDDPDISRGERNINEPIVEKMLDKVENDEVIFRETPDGTKIGKIVAIRSKFVHAHQESCREYDHLFPTDEGMETVQLDTSDAIDDKERFKPVTNRVDRHHEYILKIEKLYREENITIGGFTKLVGSNSLDTWGSLMGNPELGIRCSIGDIEERSSILNRLNDSKPKLVVDIISLITLHSLEAADIVVSTFGKFCIAQSTIDELQSIISEREGMWSKREGMIVGKKGNQYIKQIIKPEETKHGIEYLKNIVYWIRENCEVGQATAGLEMNQLRRRELNHMLQPYFLDTVLLASQPGHLLFSDDGRLRHYAKISLNNDAGTNFQIDGVWTQVLLEHCEKQKCLDKTDYDEMTIKLVCSNYYHTLFDANLLLEAAKQADWKLSEPYNSFVLALGRERMSINYAIDVSVDFLYALWEQSISFREKEFLTLCLLAGLMNGRNNPNILDQLVKQIQERYIIYTPTKNYILRRINEFEQIFPIESNFDILAEYDIRLKGTRVSIEAILYEYIYNSRPPEVIADRYYTLTIEQIYVTILYYLQNQEKIGNYLNGYLEYCRTAREKYEKDPPPGVVRLRKLIAESETAYDNSQLNTSENDKASTTQYPSKNEQE